MSPIEAELKLREEPYDVDKDSTQEGMFPGPGLTTGYAPWPFPALQLAVEEKDAAMFANEAKRVVAAISGGTGRLRAVAAR